MTINYLTDINEKKWKNDRRKTHKRLIPHRETLQTPYRSALKWLQIRVLLGGGGGLIRDHVGKWVMGYMRNIRLATSVAAEFWALRDGLLLAAQLRSEERRVGKEC